jgi:protein-L-isoaspartate O-methyltransferase
VIKPGSKVLAVGSGSGFITACLAYMVGEEGHVYGIDHIPELVQLAERNIKNSHPHLLDRITLQVGDGCEGLSDEAPYSAIYVAAAAPELPTALVNQLAKGGRMIIPIGPPDDFQQLIQVDKLPDGEIKVLALTSVRFVPMLSVEEQLSGEYSNPTRLVGENFVVMKLHHAPDSTPELLKKITEQLFVSQEKHQIEAEDKHDEENNSCEDNEYNQRQKGKMKDD